MSKRVADLAVVGGGVTGLVTLHKLLTSHLQFHRDSSQAAGCTQIDFNSRRDSLGTGSDEKVRIVLFDSLEELSPSCSLEYAICIPFTGRRYEADSCNKIDQLLKTAGDSGRRVRSIRITKSKLVAGREQLDLPSRLNGRPWCLDCCGQLTTSAAILEVRSYLRLLKSSIIQLAKENDLIELDFISDKVIDCTPVEASLSSCPVLRVADSTQDTISTKISGFQVKLACGSSWHTRHLLLATSFQTNQVQSLVSFPHEISEGINWKFTFAKALYDLDVVWHFDHLTFFVRDGSAYVYGVKTDDEPVKIAGFVANLYGATDVDLISEWRGLRSHAKLNQRVYHFCDGSLTEISNHDGSGRFLEDLLSRGLERQSYLTAPILAINAGYGRNGFCQI